MPQNRTQQQSQQQQQQQPQQQQSIRKKKYTTRKASVNETKDAIVACDEGGAGDGAEAVAAVAAAVKNRTHEKKPLHTCMEQMKVIDKTETNEAERKPNTKRAEAGSNWQQAQICRQQSKPAKNATKANEENNIPSTGTSVESSPTAEGTTMSKSARLRQKRKAAQRNKYVAMDCEMVGVGNHGQNDMLARVSIVNKRGDVLLDKFVKPRETVIDYRTSISGIRPHDIERGEEFDAVQDEVVDLLQGKILVGHAICNDLAVLHIKHPYVNIRDTSRYKPLSRLVSNGRTPSLKRLTQAILGLEIQTGEHNSIEDARAAMNIYNRLSGDWEQYIQKTQQQQAHRHQHHNHYRHQHHHKHESK